MGKKKNQHNRNKKVEEEFDETSKEDHATLKDDKKDDHDDSTKNIETDEIAQIKHLLDDDVSSDIKIDGSIDQFDRFFDMVDTFRSFATNVQSTLENFKNHYTGPDSREASAIKEMESSIEHFKNVEKEALDMVKQIQDIHESKVSNLQKNYENQFSEALRMFSDYIRKMKRRQATMNSGETQVNKSEAEHLKEIDHLQDKIDNMRANHNKAIKELENEKSSIEKEKKTWEKRAKELEAENEKAARKKGNLTDDLNSKLKAKDEKIALLEERIDKIKNEKEELHEKCRDLEKDSQKLSKEVKELKNLKENANKMVPAEHTETKLVSGCLKNLELSTESFEKLKSELIMTRIELRKANKDVEYKKTLLNDAREELDNARESIRNLEGQLKKEKDAFEDYKLATGQIKLEDERKKRKLVRLENDIIVSKPCKCYDNNLISFSFSGSQLQHRKRKEELGLEDKGQ